MNNSNWNTSEEEIKKIKLLITIKAPPYPSKSHRELVCTAGLTDQGEWMRIVPIPYRYLDDKKKYEKFDWIELTVKKHDKDHRFETYRPIDIDDIEVTGHIDTKDKWKERKRIFNGKISLSLCEYVNCFRKKCDEGKQYEAPSLFMIKPYEITDFVIEDDEPDWKHEWKLLYEQEPLFEEMKMKPLDKIPYKFSYCFKCCSDCPGHKLKIEDWEIYELARQYMGHPDELKKKVKQQYARNFQEKKDLHFFIGSQLQWHRRKGRNPYLIIGVFYPPKDNQIAMFS